MNELNFDFSSQTRIFSYLQYKLHKSLVVSGLFYVEIQNWKKVWLLNAVIFKLKGFAILTFLTDLAVIVYYLVVGLKSHLRVLGYFETSH